MKPIPNKNRIALWNKLVDEVFEHPILGKKPTPVKNSIFLHIKKPK